jgi:hypothetical protein
MYSFQKDNKKKKESERTSKIRKRGSGIAGFKYYGSRVQPSAFNEIAGTATRQDVRARRIRKCDPLNFIKR